jgi:DNA modification methylase
MTVRLLHGDCRSVLPTLKAESVHCVVTSPPYFGLRDFGLGEGALGLESTVELYVERMIEVFREVRRVLRHDGTVWLNLGDVYASSVNGRSAAATKLLGRDDRTFRDKPIATAGHGIKPKDLCLVPARVALGLQRDGWWLRSDIVWTKPNPMPESVRDRPTRAYEHVLLLAKSAHYFYDAVAVRESASGYALDGADGRNRLDVWTIATEPFPEGHFATFPTALVERCILAGSSAMGCCAKCGVPRIRLEERVSANGRRVVVPAAQRAAYGADGRPLAGDNAITSDELVRGGFHARNGLVRKSPAGWAPSCECGAGAAPCMVLDPFAGAGTVGLVADRLQRDAVLIELNPNYAKLATRRICDDSPLLTRVADQGR